MRVSNCERMNLLYTRVILCYCKSMQAGKYASVKVCMSKCMNVSYHAGVSKCEIMYVWDYSWVKLFKWNHASVKVHQNELMAEWQ